MTEAAEAFVQRLIAGLPELRASAETTFQECAAEGLADKALEFVVDDYSRDLTTRIVSGGTAASAARLELAALAALLDEEFGVDEDIDQTISSSFVVLLPGSKEVQPDVARLMGPKLAAEVARERAWRAPEASRALVQRMIEAFPSLVPDAREYENGEHSDVLAHPFMSAVAARVVQEYMSGEPRGFAEVRAILAFLESEFDDDDVADNPIAVSFVENLPYRHEAGADVVRLLGPKLRTELNRQRLSPRVLPSPAIGGADVHHARPGHVTDPHKAVRAAR